MDSTSSKFGNTSSLQLKVLFGLILCNLIWSAHPLMGKWLLEDFTPAECAWLRYTSALVAFLALRPLLPKRVDTRPPNQPIRSFRDIAFIAVLGLLAFCFSPLLQLTGLHDSRATDNALIIAMEPLITVGAAWLFLRQARLLGFPSASFLLWSAFSFWREYRFEGRADFRMWVESISLETSSCWSL